MLVLTRKLMEKLYIGENICVTVVRLEGGQVRLGIEAPRDVAVVRAELVPERESAYRGTHRPAAVRVAVPAEGSADRGDDGPTSIRIRPTSARGIDNRRRGPSR